MALRFLFIIMLFFPTLVSSQEKYTISGYVKDVASGETLIGANIYLKEKADIGTSTNTYGFYSLTLDEGTYQVVFSYLGYQIQIKEIILEKHTDLNIDMVEGIQIQEIIVTAEEENSNVTNTEMGTVNLITEQVKTIPALLGEIDILKAIQLLPGVLSAGEGNAGFYVRGGGPDQNLVLLDEAVVYNSGHMLGFFSVFNADAIKNTTLIKGTMPAQYGGRLSSVLDIQMKEGNNQKWQADGGIGLISSRFTLQGPIVKEKSSFLISARRTYVLDLAQPLINKTDFKGTNYYFYDLNAKLNYTFSQKDRVYLSTYFGRDILNFATGERDLGFRMPYGNATATLRWNHLFSEKLFSNLSLIYNDYDFSFSASQEEFKFNLISGVKDWNAKLDFDWYPNNVNNVKYGINYTYHKLTPNIVTATTGEVDFESTFKPKYANEFAVYVSDRIKISSRFQIEAGLRGSRFDQLGPYNSKVKDKTFDKNEVVKTYYGIEPRIQFNYTFTPKSSIKGGISMTNQYIHLVSNSSSTLPTDVWVPSSELIAPQRGVQYALGYFRNFNNNVVEASVEIYYKDLNNQIDYRENYVNDGSREVEDDFVYGNGRAYGVEFFIRKNKGKLTGWVGYTLSRTERWFDDIEESRVFPATYDRPHDIAIVANYKLDEKWNFGGTFIYGSGTNYTPIRSIYLIDQNLVTRYGQRNSERLDAYNRIDLGATLTPKPNSQKKFKSSWTFSVYNIYNRKNTFFTYTDFETDFNAGTAEAKAYKVSLFPVIPSVTWNFKFN